MRLLLNILDNEGGKGRACSKSRIRAMPDHTAQTPRKLYKIGANFSSETGTIEDWKVAENFVSSRANLKEDET